MDPKDFTTPKYTVTYHPIDFGSILSFLATLSEASAQHESKDEQMRKLIDAWAVEDITDDQLLDALFGPASPASSSEQGVGGDELLNALVDAWAEPSMSESDEKVANSIMLDAITKAMKK